jgi:hypothetical protein
MMEDRDGKPMKKSAKSSYFAGARTTCFTIRNQILVPVLCDTMSGEYAFKAKLCIIVRGFYWAYPFRDLYFLQTERDLRRIR